MMQENLKSKKARSLMTGVEITKVSRAHSKFTGLKTPIPATYARDLEVQAGDSIVWESTIEDGKRVLKVRKYITMKKEETTANDSQNND